MLAYSGQIDIEMAYDFVTSGPVCRVTWLKTGSGMSEAAYLSMSCVASL